jgi:L-ascorbate metabolism protein UlaG (beta-lactamase superfamily)
MRAAAVLRKSLVLMFGVVTGLSLVVVLAGFGVGCVLSAPAYRGRMSDHFDGERFRNLTRSVEHGFGDFLKWQASRRQGPWREWTAAEPGLPPPRLVEGGAMRVTFVNHATLLLQMDGLNILTDPIWSERASPVSFAGPKRVRPPGIRFEDLPPIDVVLVSHNHYDHMDLPTLERLASTFHARFYVGLGNARFLAEHGIEGAIDLDWWQSVELAPGVKLTAVPSQHFSARGMTDRNKTLWTGFVVSGSKGSAYFAGDTGYGSHFRAIQERLGPMRVALLPIGAYRPRWFMRPVHMSPRDAIRAALDLEAQTSVAMHFGTFPLADDGEEEPSDELRVALASEPQLAPERFWILGFGEGREVP